jgi:GT2 family glycosyltransferase
MFDVNDIQIFITTHNRARLVQQTINSFLAQTARPQKITVLDNESRDNTIEVIASYEDKGVEYIKTEGFLGNYKKAKQIADKPLVMLFHDDDILHPRYLELAIKALNKYPKIGLITTRYTEFFDNNAPSEFPPAKEPGERHYLFKTQKDFARYMYFCERIAYASAIYKTDIFKKVDLEYDKFGKFNDWPFMVKAAKYGAVILFEDEDLLYVRRHDLQDTWTNANTINLRQIVNWDKFFFEAMDINFWTPLYKRAFRFKSSYFMKGKYDAFLSKEDKNKITIDDLYQLAQANKVPFCKNNSGRKIYNKIYKTLNKKRRITTL